MNNNQKDVYAVCLLRTDGNAISIEVDNLEKATEKWEYYTNKWTVALHEKKPLIIIEKDHVTAFDPIFVYEIILRKKDFNISNNQNPYYKEMVEKGFNSTFNNKNFSRSNNDLLDQGFKN